MTTAVTKKFSVHKQFQV